MTLQELIGELLTLSQAYPDTTPVKATLHDFGAAVVGVTAESIGDEVVIRLATQGD